MRGDQEPIDKQHCLCGQTRTHQMTGLNVNVNGAVPAGYSIQAVKMFLLVASTDTNSLLSKPGSFNTKM